MAISDFERQRKHRKKIRDISPLLDPLIEFSKNNKNSIKRRESCRDNPELFCTTYYPNIFYNPFSDEQKNIIAAIKERCMYGGMQSIAATRGSGKSSIIRTVAGVWAIVYGYANWLVLIGPSSEDAEGALLDIKSRYTNTDSLLYVDFPEVCFPICAIQDSPLTAKSQIYKDDITRLSWSKNEIIFPTIAGSLCSGAIIKVKTIEKPIRGLLRDGKRPDLIIADDIETDESARSFTQTNTRKRVMIKDVMGLGGPNTPMSVFFVGTIIKKGCLTDQFTDKKEYPAWSGIRYKFMYKPPDNMDLWNQYIQLRKENQYDGDKYARIAHQFYIDNQKEMDKGCIISDPCRYISKPIPEAQHLKRLKKNHYIEISAIQHCYNEIADKGQDFFDSEYQNNPQEEMAESEKIESIQIQRKLSGIPQGMVPKWAACLTCHVDVMGRALYWSLVAMKSDGQAVIVDYGTETVYSPVAGKLTSDDNIEETQRAIFTALCNLRDQFAEGWPIEGSEDIKKLDVGLVDTGWQLDPIEKFIKSCPGNTWRAAKGYGSGKKQKYKHQRNTKHIKSGNHWWASSQGSYILYNIDADHWKNYIQTGFIMPDKSPGSISLYGNQPIIHKVFAEHITSEVWQKRFIAGKGWQEGFVIQSKHNHWLDCTANACAAADIIGVKVINNKPEIPQKRIKLSELQSQKRAERAYNGR